MTHSSSPHLPITEEECKARGWDEVDIVLVTGDAYIDHPAFGVAIIGRLLEHHGHRVAILPQPRHDTNSDFFRFGKPRLFFGITAGNLDSIVANYTGNGKIRDFDAYSKDGHPYRNDTKNKINRLRPDRATIAYTNLARSAYNDVPVILGGVEASLRKFIHFDYKQNHLRSSVLTDGKGDFLIYGMGEKSIVEIAEKLKHHTPLSGIKGTCERKTEKQYDDFILDHPEDLITILPSWNEIQEKKSLFMEAELTIDRLARSYSQKTIAQRQKSGWIVQHPPQPICTPNELDKIYDLPFTRTPHPLAGDIPAYRMIRHSITTMRGCSGNCSFCSITRHQGPTVSSRSQSSVIREAKSITEMMDFSGTISDLGGPTANLYGTRCDIGGCKKHDCLFPEVCKHLQIDEQAIMDLLKNVSSVKGVKHLFISSGLRMELLLKTPKLFEAILKKHTPGSLKIAPEHTEDEILEHMHKEPHKILCRFVQQCRDIAQSCGKNTALTPYIITGHPGSNPAATMKMVKKLKKQNLTIRKFQDFTPTPGTISTAMFATGVDKKKKTIHIPSVAEKRKQRKIVEDHFFHNGRKIHRKKQK